VTLVKICGITSRADADAAIAAGADRLGFIGVEGSPRYLTPDAFRAVTAGLRVPKVLVVQRLADAAAYASAAADNPTPTLPFVREGSRDPLGAGGFDYVQFYEESDGRMEPPVAADRLVRVFRMKDAASLAAVLAFGAPIGALHLDTHHPDKLGGAGTTFDWSLAADAVATIKTPIILAGGLTPDNVAQALDAVRPYAVDVASGVEARPGVKDHGKVRAFIQAVREWDASHHAT